MDNRPRYRVPDELRETLLDFTIAYLLERPANLPSFGLSFFQRLKEEREGRGGRGPGRALNGGSGGETEDLEGNPLLLDDALTDWILQFSIVYLVERPPDILLFGIRYSTKKAQLPQ
jgi:hypothetical protein